MISIETQARVGAHFRRNRGKIIRRVLDKIPSPRIVDLGGTYRYWRRLSEILPADAKVDIVNISPLVEPIADSRFTFFETDACQFSGEYDFVHSNSAIEHVGSWAKMEELADTARRLAPSYYVQTPNFWFPYDPHSQRLFFHWMPDSIRARAHLRGVVGFHPHAKDMGAAMREVEHCRMLTRTQFQALFPEASIIDETAFGIRKSFVALVDGTDGALANRSR